LTRCEVLFVAFFNLPRFSFRKDMQVYGGQLPKASASFHTGLTIY